jgi:hypothetical protein
MQNSKVGEVDVFSKQKHLYCLSCIQNFDQDSLHYIRNPQILVRKFNNVAKVTTIVFCNVTSISEIVPIGNGEKGLRLHNF